ncbi:MAG: shikimate dehydrogenase [Flavobacteriales bacterium]|nr:shikimate dehydrogenase [Flavobacteriales bacterium]
MKQFGLIGFPLSHSFSKNYFTEKFKKENISDCHYELYPIEDISAFPDLIRNTPNLVGLNVTIPYKEVVMQYLDELDPIAKEAGAVNTIVASTKDSRTHLKGYNTDVYGFQNSINAFVQSEANALILGTGGASKAVEFSLNNMGIKTTFVSRSPKDDKTIAYTEVTKELLGNYQIVVNSSPIGMYPNVNESPDISYEGLTPTHVLFDLVYNPLETQFLKEGIKRGSTVINGLKMLHLQAEKAWEIWNS